MRAIYHDFDNHFDEEAVSITGDSAHHLMVARVKVGEKILLLNGKGTKISGEILSVSKNNIDVKISQKESFTPAHDLSLAVAMPKKDAFEDILKMAVELGIKEIHPLVSDFSQYEYVASDRVTRILESALIQSNNPFFPIIHAQKSLKDFLVEHANDLVFFNSQKDHSIFDEKAGTRKTILIGAEGGFSAEEISLILKHPKVQQVHLPTPILRAPTAVASSVGYLLAGH